MSRGPGGVAGYCPMGCGKTLMVADGGHITCRRIECPNPSAVTDVLHDAETEHVVEFRQDDFDIKHPLRERLEGNPGGDLWGCELHQFIQRLNGPPVQPGRYRSRRAGEQWTWERLGDAS